ncbi:MAG TPA: hypothetical protein VM098_06945 [Phycisphaerae bacterium]|nr:hypothetical protein [Phycisphaerae bacterium]
MLYNRVKDDTRLPAGMVVKTPELKAILAEEGLVALMGEEVDLLLTARSQFMAVEDGLWELRRASGGRPAPLAVTEEMKQTLLTAAESVDQAARGFAQRKPGVVQAPVKTIGQLKSLSATLRSLAAGVCDENGYDIDMVHQRLVHAMVNAIHWARSGYR